MILRSISLVATAVLAHTLLRGWPAALPAVMRACLAVLVLVAGVGLWGRRDSGDSPAARSRRSPHWLDYVAIATAVLAIESAFLLFLGTTPRPLEAVAIRLEQRFRPQAAALRAVENPDITRSGNWLWNRETRRPLPKRTRYKPGMKPEVFIRPEELEDALALLQTRIHVRAFALGRYQDATWAPLDRTPLEIRAKTPDWMQLAAAPPGRAIVHEIFHAADPGGQNPLTALQGATTAQLPALTRIDDGFHLLPPPNTTGGYQYRATSTPLRLDDLPDDRLLAPRRDAPAPLLEISANESFRTRIQSLAREAAGTGSLKQQLVQLRNHLRDSLDYSLVTDNPDNLDPIENFLFEEKRGHCEFFATSAALMVRSLGIPSRVAYGWAGGTWYESSGLFVFRANEAHAWTEIWLESYGWVAIDPTPQAIDGGNQTRVAPPGESLPGALAGDEQPDDPAADTSAALLPPLALGLMAAFAVPAGLILVLRGKRHSRDPLESGPPSATTLAPGYYQAWRRACAAHGSAPPPGATLRRQIERHPDAPDFAAELLAYHYATRYEGRCPDPRVEKQLERRIRRWEAIAISPPPR